MCKFRVRALGVQYVLLYSLGTVLSLAFVHKGLLWQVQTGQVRVGYFCLSLLSPRLASDSGACLHARAHKHCTLRFYPVGAAPMEESTSGWMCVPSQGI